MFGGWVGTVEGWRVEDLGREGRDVEVPMWGRLGEHRSARQSEYNQTEEGSVGSADVRDAAEMESAAHLTLSITKTNLHLTLSPLLFASISSNSCTYPSVVSTLAAFLYTPDRAVQYRVYRLWSLVGGRTGWVRGGISGWSG